MRAIACDAGRLAYLAGRIPKRRYATASSPVDGQIESRPRWAVRLVVGGWWLVVSGWRSVVGGRWLSVGSGRWLVAGWAVGGGRCFGG
jgi:hypothetical protein